jgi:transcriptional regulator with XRE-family HTH domain
MTLLRTQLGTTLRGHRLRQRRTLRDVSGRARVSLGYLSEVERGQKEASSELLASICDALDVELADLLAEVSSELRGAGADRQPVRSVGDTGREPVRSVDGADREPAEETGTGMVTAPAAAGEPALALVGSGHPARGAGHGGAVRLAA